MQLLLRFRPLLCAATLLSWLVTSGLAGPAQAAENRWESIGPFGGNISALAVAPSHRRTLYAGTSEGLIFRSTNAGATWTSTATTLTPTPVADIEVDPRDPATAYAAVCAVLIEFGVKEGGIFKTTDAGRNWSLSETLPECEVFELAIDPRTSRLYAASAAGLLYSDDGAESWHSSPGLAGEGSVTAVVVDPGTAGTLYALHFQHGFLKSVDGGTTWVARNAGLPADRWRLFRLAASSGAPRTLYVGAFEAAAPVFRSTDGGESWSPAGSGLGGRRVHDLAVVRASGVAFAATDDGVFRSADRGLTWTPPVTSTGPASTLAVPPSPAGVVYAGHRGPGVFKSTDGGVSWRSANSGLAAIGVNDFAIAPSNPTVLYARTTEAKVLRSLDGGATWQPGAGIDGLPLALAVHPRNPRTAFAAGFQGGIWKTTDAGATWRQVNSPETVCMVALDLAIDPLNPNNVYVAGPFTPCPQWPDVCLGFKSTDAGESWSCMEGLPTQGILALALAPSLPSVLYAGTEAIGQRPVFKSTDAGQVWRARSTGLPQGFVSGLAVSPRDPRTVYATSQQGLYKSVNGAASWTPVPGLPPHASLGIPVITPNNPSVVYIAASVSNGIGVDPVVFRSTTAGPPWTPLVRAGLPQAHIQSLQLSPRNPRALYVASASGIFKLTLPAQP